ncbi:DUF2808 domain-containing protein [Picosynechococcus sp. PCC 73109]|uniref:DUF2808 domain-containing protein n=1 Tax=Picosynechococcus sp. PCC 73109 TaxID=374982 RepID=UPI0007457F0C|nr:DUF2808 domain-containing protein [Picosynechococcus sp. PCC 73109]AMA08741.1 hypothetical protein AWQ23_05090 [Picosynechococcus sp. PCC 73109]
MQLFRSPLSRLAIATTLLSSSLTFMPQMAEARQPCGSFTINWGGTIPQGDILKCAVEYNSGARRRDRYYLEIKKSKIVDRFQTFELSFPEDFDGRVDDAKIRVRVNGREVALNEAATAWDPDSLPTDPAQQSQTILGNIAASTTTPDRGGELVLVNGELVFLDSETLAAQQASQSNNTNNNNNPAPEPEIAEEPEDEGPRSRSLVITLAEPLSPESDVEIILDSVNNPSRGGMYLITAFARSQGAPLPSRLGSWLLDVDF